MTTKIHTYQSLSVTVPAVIVTILQIKLLPLTDSADYHRPKLC